jgi:hypothetical protein
VKPSVGRIVHYRSYGTPGGEYPAVCRAAIVTAVDTYQDGGDPDQHLGHVDLCVLNPTGQFFNRGVLHHEGDPDHVDATPGHPTYRPGTWHWPERV